MKSLFFRILRWMLAVGAFVLCVRLMSRALHSEGFAAAGPLIVSFGALITGVLLISPETVSQICDPFARFFAGLIYPDTQFAKPPLSYKLARYYARHQRIVEAVQEYEKLLRYYPKEREAYLELIEIAQTIGHSKLEQKYVRKFQKHCPDVPRD